MDLTNYLTLGLPIPVAGLGTIYQPSLEELVSYEGEFQNLFQPYTISKQLFSEEIIEDDNLKDFDLLFLIAEDNTLLLKGSGGGYLLDDIMRSLCILYRTEDIKLLFEEQRIIIDKGITIDRFNYNKLCDIVLTLSVRERMEKEEELHFKSKRRKELHEKLEKYRLESRIRNAILIGDMVNMLLINPVRAFTYEEIKKMTLWQLYNNYNQLMSVDNFEQMMKYKVSYKYNVEDEVEHWSKRNKMQKIVID